MKLKSLHIISVLMLTGCAQSTFIPTGLTSHSAVNTNKDCNAKVLTSAPSVKFEDIGLCLAEAPGGGIVRDATIDVVQELQKCACSNGGEALILNSTDEAGLIGLGIGGYSQQKVKGKAIVIVFSK